MFENKWYARQDSNMRPLVPETSALSVLSYGRMLDSKGLMEFQDCSNGPTLPDIVPGISSRRFQGSFGDNTPIRILQHNFPSESSVGFPRHESQRRIVTWSHNGFLFLLCHSPMW